MEPAGPPLPPSLVGRLVEAAEADRAAIANALHDDAVQALAASVMHLGLLARRVPAVAAEPEWERTRENLDHGLRATRALLVDLRPPALARQGLAAALRQQLERVARQAGCDTRLDWHAPDHLEPLVEALAFRAAQEALTNAARHARPELVTVTVTSLDHGVTVEVTDDGPGLPPGTVPRRPGAWLHVELLGGSVAAGPTPAGGATVVIWIPHPGHGGDGTVPA